MDENLLVILFCSFCLAVIVVQFIVIFLMVRCHRTHTQPSSAICPVCGKEKLERSENKAKCQNCGYIKYVEEHVRCLTPSCKKLWGLYRTRLRN